MDRLTQMESFMAVAEHGGFTAGARATGRAKAQLSKQVAALESRLGVRLFDRTTRRLALTEPGRAYLERARRTLDELREAEAAATSLHAEPRGLLRLSAPGTFSRLYLSPLLAEFAGQWPRLELQLDLTDRFVDLVAEGYDAAIRIGTLPDSSLAARRLAPVCGRVAASPAYIARHGAPATPADLARHECLLYRQPGRRADWQFRDGPVKVGGRIRADNGDALLSMALAGLGIVMLPDFICGPDLAAGRLTPLLTEHLPEDPVSVQIVFPSARLMNARLRALVDFLVERFRGEVPWACPG